MSFLNPFFLIGSLVLAVPVLIHLVRREKSEVFRFSSLMFLLKVPKRTIRQQKLKNLLLMLLRLLILALLVAAFMRPYLSESAATAAAAGQSQGIVMLLDNSYSMRYGTNFDKMKTEANNGLTPWAAATACRWCRSMITPRSGPTDVGQESAQGCGCHHRTSAFAELDITRHSLPPTACCSSSAIRQKQLIMISDFQRAGWNRSSRENVIGKDVKAEMVNLGVDNSKNIGIDNVSVDATSFTRTFGGRVVARIHNYRKDQPVTVPVSLSMNDKEVGGAAP